MLPFSDIGSLLPSNWSVLSLHVTPDEESLLAVQHTPGNCPLILQLPFDRISRREGDDSLFNLQAAKAEMSNIIYSANATSQNAKNVTSLEDRRSWWTERKALDRRLAAILVNIEKRWLGAYKVRYKFKLAFRQAVAELNVFHDRMYLLGAPGEPPHLFRKMKRARRNCWLL